jgi:hypothetical protein
MRGAVLYKPGDVRFEERPAVIVSGKPVSCVPAPTESAISSRGGRSALSQKAAVLAPAELIISAI